MSTEFVVALARLLDDFFEMFSAEDRKCGPRDTFSSNGLLLFLVFLQGFREYSDRLLLRSSIIRTTEFPPQFYQTSRHDRGGYILKQKLRLHVR